MNDNNKYIKPKEASRIIGVTIPTLRRMAKAGKIQHIKTDSERYLFNISSFINRGNTEIPDRKKICYARVSGRNQKTDLQNQINLLSSKYQTHEIISDYGSGLNFKRKGFLKILDLANEGKIEELVVTYKDRLCRFGFELISHILEKQSNAKIVVLCHSSTSTQEELSNDLLAIITVFSARMHGLRKYKNKVKNDPTLFIKEIPDKNEANDRIV